MTSRQKEYLVKYFVAGSRRSLIRGAVCLTLAAINTILPQPAGAAEEFAIAPVEVGTGPYCFDTAEQHDIRVDILARGLSHAYSLAFLPNADALIVERGTRLRLLRNATTARPLLVAMPVAGIPSFAANEHAGPDDVLGIQDVALHPDFAKNHLVYYTFNRPVDFDPVAKRLRIATVLARARLEGLRLVDSRDLLVGETVRDVGGSRIMFGRGNHSRDSSMPRLRARLAFEL
jgi:aldose sugar dehydrogenase